MEQVYMAIYARVDIPTRVLGRSGNVGLLFNSLTDNFFCTKCSTVFFRFSISHTYGQKEVVMFGFPGVLFPTPFGIPFRHHNFGVKVGRGLFQVDFLQTTSGVCRRVLVFRVGGLVGTLGGT